MPDRRGRNDGGLGLRPYPRSARVNSLVLRVLAEELERLSDLDERLGLATITGVEVDPEQRHATVWLGSLPDEMAVGLGERRVELQAAIARQARLKRTPQLQFRADPAVESGQRVEQILRGLGGRDG